MIRKAKSFRCKECGFSPVAPVFVTGTLGFNLGACLPGKVGRCSNLVLWL